VLADVFSSYPQRDPDSRDRLAELMRDARRQSPEEPDGDIPDGDVPVETGAQRAAAPHADRPPALGPGSRVRRFQDGNSELLSRLRDTVGRHRVAVGLTALVILGGLGALLYGSSSTPRAEAPPPLPVAVASSAPSSPPSSTPVVISVVGKVEHPGLVTVPPGARVADALAAAGGARHGTNLLGLNLASKVTDGQQILVGVTPPPGAPSTAHEAAGAGGAAGGKVDLNTADEQALESLSGVGPVTAKHIMDWRAAHGGFESTRQLEDITGIGPKTYDALEDSVTVG
jgi:competence protein ComEA